MPNPQKFKAKVAEKEFVSSRVLRVRFQLVEPNEITFSPGQFISLRVSETTFRSYSISSDANQKSQIEILVTVDHEGAGANFLKRIQIGEVVELIGPAGKFMLPQILSKNIIFVITGTGIAPMFSMLKQLVHIHYAGNIQVYLGYRDQSELIEQARLEALKKELSGLNYTLCFSQSTEEDCNKWCCFKGRVTDKINYADFEPEGIYKGDYQIFLCGNPFMVGEVYNKLKEHNVPEDKITHEKFTVSVPKVSTIA